MKANTLKRLLSISLIVATLSAGFASGSEGSIEKGSRWVRNLGACAFMAGAYPYAQSWLQEQTGFLVGDYLDDFAESYIGYRPVLLLASAGTAVAFAGLQFLEYRQRCERDALIATHQQELLQRATDVTEEKEREKEELLRRHQEEVARLDEQFQAERKRLMEQQEAEIAQQRSLREADCAASEAQKVQLRQTYERATEENERLHADNLRSEMCRALQERVNLLREQMQTFSGQYDEATSQNRDFEASHVKTLLDGKRVELIEALANLLEQLRSPGSRDEHRAALVEQEMQQLRQHQQRTALSGLLDSIVSDRAPELFQGWVSYTRKHYAKSAKVFDSVIDLAKKAPRKSKRIKHLNRALESIHENGKGRLWGVATARDIDFAITPEYTDESRTILQRDHSRSMWKKWHDAIVSAESYVDITSLSPPDEGEGGFRDILKAAIVALAIKSKQKAEPIQVRILFATIPAFLGLNSGAQSVDTQSILNDLVSAKISIEGEPEAFVRDANIDISVGTFDASVGWNLSWNHSKIVAADNHTFFTGGHNLYNSYLFQDPVRPALQAIVAAPVHDVSVLLRGKDVALVAHRFVDQLWNYIIEKNRNTFSPYNRAVEAHTFRKSTGKIETCFRNAAAFLAPFKYGETVQGQEEAINEEEQGLFPVISVGRLGYINPKEAERNVSDAAIVELIRSTKHAVFISQQRMVPLTVAGRRLSHRFNDQVFQQLAQLIESNRHVFILVSSDDPKISGEGVFGYPSGSTPESLCEEFLKKLLANQLIKSEQQARRQIAKYLHVLPTANGSGEVPNHSKVIISDGDCAYIGSSNVYDDSHQEKGIIFGRVKSVELLERMFRPLWESSVRHWLARHG